jgi:hypothetical protein
MPGRAGLLSSMENCTGLLVIGAICVVDMIVAKPCGFVDMVPRLGLARSISSDCVFDINGSVEGVVSRIPRFVGFDMTVGNEGFESSIENMVGFETNPAIWLFVMKLTNRAGWLLIAESDGLERNMLNSPGFAAMFARLPPDTSMDRPLGSAAITDSEGFVSRLARL